MFITFKFVHLKTKIYYSEFIKIKVLIVSFLMVKLLKEYSKEEF